MGSRNSISTRRLVGATISFLRFGYGPEITLCVTHADRSVGLYKFAHKSLGYTEWHRLTGFEGFGPANGGYLREFMQGEVIRSVKCTRHDGGSDNIKDFELEKRVAWGYSTMTWTTYVIETNRRTVSLRWLVAGVPNTGHCEVRFYRV